MPTNPDRLAELEEERRFLLRSLSDLEREHEAGDVDVDDYQTLRDGYTVRAASVLRCDRRGPGERAAPAGRELAEASRRGGGRARRRGWSRLVRRPFVRATPRRTGALRTRPTRRDPGAARAGAAVSLEDPAQAAAIYGEVIGRDPDHVEALTYYGWTTALTAATTSDAQAAGDLLLDAVKQLSRATELDPSYPDPFCFLGIVEYRFLGEAEVALPNVDKCLAGGPPADVRDLVEGLRAQIAAEIDDA